MPPLKVLEVMLAARSAQQQPVGVWPSDSAAEGHIQPPRGLVDEIVHVGLVPTVVIAREQHPALVVNKHPPRKMNRLHAGQIAARKYVAGGELNDGEYERDEGASERARLRRAKGCVLVRNIVIFEALQLHEQGRVRAR